MTRPTLIHTHTHNELRVLQNHLLQLTSPPADRAELLGGGGGGEGRGGEGWGGEAVRLKGHLRRSMWQQRSSSQAGVRRRAARGPRCLQPQRTQTIPILPGRHATAAGLSWARGFFAGGAGWASC